MMRKETALDTSVLIDHFKADPAVINRFAELDFLLIPVPVVAEMEFGYPRLKNHQPGLLRFKTFLDRDDVGIIVCDRRVAERFAAIKQELRAKGGMLPVNDIWIAACCLAAGKTLATRDKHFLRIPDLSVEMW